MRGVSPLLSVPHRGQRSRYRDARRAARCVVLGFMTYFVLFALLMGGLYLAIDSTAGERERGSLGSAAQPAGGALRAGGRQDSGDLRLHVHFVGA